LDDNFLKNKLLKIINRENNQIIYERYQKVKNYNETKIINNDLINIRNNMSKEYDHNNNINNDNSNKDKKKQ